MSSVVVRLYCALPTSICLGVLSLAGGAVSHRNVARTASSAEPVFDLIGRRLDTAILREIPRGYRGLFIDTGRGVFGPCTR